MVQEIIYKQGKWPSYDKPMLKLRACWEGDATPFGCGYTCAIGDTVTEGAHLQRIRDVFRTKLLLNLATGMISQKECSFDEEAAARWRDPRPVLLGRGQLLRRLQGMGRAAAHTNTWCTAACLKVSPMSMALRASPTTRAPSWSSSSKRRASPPELKASLLQPARCLQMSAHQKAWLDGLAWI